MQTAPTVHCGCVLAPINLSDSRELHSLVEHRRVFTMNQYELNIFETYHSCSGVVLSYDGLVITSMLRGKKVMHLPEKSGFDFLPGETVILPEGVSMQVDFPEADEKHPVQCATVTLDWDVVNQNLAFLNEQYPQPDAEWTLNFSQYHFYNNRELANVINKLISISMEDDLAKDALADLTLKSLLIRVIQTQRMANVDTGLPKNSRFDSVVDYIRAHLTEKISVDTLCRKACMSKSSFFRAFRDVFGLSPVEYIIRERINLAKRLLIDPDPATSVSDVGYRVGFNNLHYFSRLFKLLEGITPSAYRQQYVGQSLLA